MQEIRFSFPGVKLRECSSIRNSSTFCWLEMYCFRGTELTMVYSCDSTLSGLAVSRFFRQNRSSSYLISLFFSACRFTWLLARSASPFNRITSAFREPIVL